LQLLDKHAFERRDYHSFSSTCSPVLTIASRLIILSNASFNTSHTSLSFIIHAET
jgi:hypothetical protein